MRRPPLHFGTKAETLQALDGRVRCARLLPQLHFDRRAWTGGADAAQGLLREVARRFPGKAVAVRSSAQSEDTGSRSNAGAYCSVLGVDVRAAGTLREAIERVLAAMPGDAADQVLLQPMVGPVAMSGVLLTYDLVHGAPYYVIDYDDRTGRTDSVTSGASSRSVSIYRDVAPDAVRSPRMARLLAMARELERLFDGAPLDIEFALTRSNQLYLLQVRRVSVATRWHPVTERRVARQLVFVERFVRESSAPQPGMLGSRTILGVMPDWNPAEIVGTTPRPLAVSLYRQLVTRSVWREARAFIGYRRLPPAELMQVINGHPYIDVRASFNSWLPADLDAQTGTLLVDNWLGQLEAAPQLHDKVEFAVAQTCLDFEFDRRLRASGALDRARARRFRAAAQALTLRCLDAGASGTLAQAVALTAERERAQAVRGPIPADARGRLREAVALIADCRRAGTFAFAVIARHAFIAEALLRSAVARGVLGPERVDMFRATLRTVTSGLLDSHAAVMRGRLSRQRFLARFGHLRPGTYDIASLRYDEREDLFTSRPLPPRTKRASAEFVLSARERRALDLLLREAGLTGIRAGDMFDYASRAIVGREHAKFVFTRDLSDALALLVLWGEQEGLSREDLSFVDWLSIESVLCAPVIDHADRHFLEIAERGRRAFGDAQAFRLPHLIRSPRDVYVATDLRSVPNFIGTGEAQGQVQMIDSTTPLMAVQPGSIACIDNADPGFDWIFTRGIGGLVTRFGGINSHMAIRCAELSLPAAIGCGETLYGQVSAARWLELNCAQKVLRVRDA
jgi:glutamine kinase